MNFPNVKPTGNWQRDRQAKLLHVAKLLDYQDKLNACTRLRGLVAYAKDRQAARRELSAAMLALHAIVKDWPRWWVTFAGMVLRDCSEVIRRHK